MRRAGADAPGKGVGPTIASHVPAAPWASALPVAAVSSRRWCARTVGGNTRELTAIKADAQVATWCETVQIAQSAPRARSVLSEHFRSGETTGGDIMKSRLLAMFAVLGLLVGAATVFGGDTCVNVAAPVQPSRSRIRRTGR